MPPASRARLEFFACSLTHGWLAIEITGTLRAISGFTAPVTSSSEFAFRATAATVGYCSGWSTVKRLASAKGMTCAGGGCSVSWFPCAVVQPLSGNSASRKKPGV